MSFYDEYNLVHCKPKEVSENASLFTAEWLLLEQMTQENSGMALEIAATSMISTLWNPEEGRYQDRGGVAGYHWSHDNMTGIYAMSSINGWLPKSGLEKQTTTPNRFIHPRDILFYGMVERRWWATLAYPLVYLLLLVFSIQPCLKPVGSTSGKLLWFVRARTMINEKLFMANLFYSIINRIAEYRHGDKPWVKIFATYFPYEDHPSNILARHIWR